MWTQDFVRVLQGARKVANELARSQGSEVSAKTEQLTKHATELTRVLPHCFQATANVPPSGGMSTASGTSVSALPDVGHTHNAHRNVLPKSTVAQTKVTPSKLQHTSERPPPDLIRSRETNPTSQATHVKNQVKNQTSQAQSQTVQVKNVNKDQTNQERYQPIPTKNQTSPTLRKDSTLDKDAAATPEELPPRRVWEEKHVPSSPLSRILGFGGLAARLAMGTAAEIVRTGGKNGTYNALVSDANAEKLAETLCTMRGAALKLGQMLSIQDEAMIPSTLTAALNRVREKYVRVACCYFRS